MATAKNRYMSDDHEDFTVDGRDAVVHVLRGMVRKDIVLSGAFNGGREVLLTAVLEVDTELGVVYLDINANEERNQLIRQTKRIIFFANFDGAKVQWASSSIDDDIFDGRKAFRIEIPEKLQRIQRRTSYRVNTPVTNPVTCRIRTAEDRDIQLRLVDISVDGIGVIVPGSFKEDIQKNMEFRNCTIEHSELGTVTVALSVQSLWEVDTRNGDKSQRAGLEFASFQGRAQSNIQRFIFKMEQLLRDTSKEQ
jgi:c-di-GMP-binding flagellar brake protein YcgR